MRTAANRPVDTLRGIAAPRELVEWVRKMPPDDAIRRAWADVTRVEWLPYLAVLRGIGHDAIWRATCGRALAVAEPVLELTEEGARVADFLRVGVAVGRDGLVHAEDALDDLRRAMLAHGERPGAPSWMIWCGLILELARGAKRGNPLIPVSLALRTLVGQGGRRATTELIARLRDELAPAEPAAG